MIPRRLLLGALLVAVVGACGVGSGLELPPPVTDVRAAVREENVLSADVTVAAGRPVLVRVTATSGDHEVGTDWTTEPALEPTVTLLGMRAEEDYRLEVEARTEEGGVAEVTLDHRTPALPETLPELDVRVADGERMAPGLTMFDVGSWGDGGGRGRTAGTLLMLDDEGEVVWYHQNPFITVGDATLTDRGTILINYPPFGVRELDLLGTNLRSWVIGGDSEEATIPLDPPTPGRGNIHHVANPLPNGNILTLGEVVITPTEAEMAAMCPDGYGEPFELVDNTIIEFTTEGEVVREWRLSDIVPPVDHPGTKLCGERGGLKDWAHTNAAVYDEATNAIVVSPRNLDLVLAFRYEDDAEGPSGELLWSLGTNGTLELTEGEPSYHQHAPEIEPDGSMLLYDNGNGRPGHTVSGPGPRTYSRAVLYDLDLEGGTARQVWEHRVDDLEREGPLFAAFLGDADRLENGNVLIDHGGIDRNRPPARGRIIEVVPEGDAGGDIVLDVVLPGPWVSYRAERIPDLFSPEG